MCCLRLLRVIVVHPASSAGGTSPLGGGARSPLPAPAAVVGAPETALPAAPAPRFPALETERPAEASLPAAPAPRIVVPVPPAEPEEGGSSSSWRGPLPVPSPRSLLCRRASTRPVAPPLLKDLQLTLRFPL